MSRFKVGDYVKVKKDLVDGGKYGEWYFDGKMLDFRGKFCKVERVTPTGYRISGFLHAWFTDGMLEDARLSQDYNVGDKVVVRTNTPRDIPYGFNDTMDAMSGKVVTIIQKSTDPRGYCSYLVDGSCWTWTDMMFEGLAPEKDVAPEPVDYRFLIIEVEFHDCACEITEERLREHLSTETIEWLKSRANIDGVYAQRYPLEEIIVVVSKGV